MLVPFYVYILELSECVVILEVALGPQKSINDESPTTNQSCKYMYRN
jgi:hypothetical protein